MTRTDVSLLAELEAGLRDEKSSTTSLLQKCILLGGKVGSERLRDWARQELKGYPNASAVPEYRRVVAGLFIDGVTYGGHITGQQISTMALPEFARGKITEDLNLTNALGELEDLSHGSGDSVKLQPGGAPELVALWNHQRGPGDLILRLYWQVGRSTLVGVVTGVRTALAELVAEMLASAPDEHQPPTKQAVDDAIHLVLTGNRNTVTMVGAQTTTNGQATIATTGSAEESDPDHGTWWQRWRRRGMIIGLATIVTATVTVFLWTGWVPWK